MPHSTHPCHLSNSPELKSHVLFFKLQDRVIEAQNSSQHPYEACLIADLSSDVQHQILNIGNYVFRPLSFILAFLTFVFNTLVIIAVARTKSL